MGTSSLNKCRLMEWSSLFLLVTRVLAVLAVVGIVMDANMVYAQRDKPLRHFMQDGAETADEPRYGDNKAAGHYADAGDAKIYYEVYGKGSPLVILHGGVFGSMFEMHEFINRLAKDYEIIAISTRGHGKSEIGSKPVTYEQRANDVMAVVNQVTSDKFTLLGFSDGAYTGYKVASMFPDRVVKLVAIGAGEQVPGLRKVVLNTDEAFKLDPPYWEQQQALMPEPKRLGEYWKSLEIFYNTMVASKELFASIKCPVLVMAGERDMNAPLATIIAAYQMIPNSQLSIIPNAPHPVFLVNFPAVWEAMEPFLQRS
ncbi:alpha/beta hydrolase (plasmid) [Agrobacterium leguminum]|uniref:Alpha/beta hydrolase fold containing protein n=1 Tax=Agrobacterium deltaense NCPPB 1641 TaxID=1183425 RepID=A0A1S7UB08_9HYPH|nr:MULTISPECIES: alpha/beta hydrolase [Agrobacterium]WFS69771.1 alpha/beta hydrolase [Agrobacterium leguminum]CVI64086.1 Alpha/beta hydrolase fold containing protein [Agrobacterium deltaense NCPPB 1641]